MTDRTAERVWRRARRARRWAGLVVGVLLAGSAPAAAQPTSGGNTGAVKLTGGLDVPSVYVFRGFIEETDPKLTLQPYGDIGVILKPDGDGSLKRLAVNFGVWNSLHTGSSGTGGPTKHLHYEEDFYTTLNLGFGGGFGVAATYVAFTSPNFTFETIQEFDLKVTKTGRFNPYVFVATELTDVSQDGGEHKGTYLELGAGPVFHLGKAPTLTVPVKVGLSANDYYELQGKDHRFGFFSVGGLITLPMAKIPSRYGAWNVHGGADVLFLGDAPKSTTSDHNTSTKAVALFGVGVTY